MPEPEILAVRQLATEPTDESVTRSWYQITRLQAPRPRRGRRLVPAMAAAVVVLMAVGTVVVMKLGDGGMSRPVASTPEAVAALNALADTAAAGNTPAVGPDQLVKSEIEGWGTRFAANANGIVDAGTMFPQDRASYFDPHTGEIVKIVQNGQDLLEPGEKGNADPQDVITPGINFPTVDWVANLPTDPRQLLTALRNAVGENDIWTVDHQVWDAIGQLYHDFDAALTAQQRANLLRALAGMSGLTTRFVTIEGQSLVGFRLTERESAQEIYFDPYTGRAAGRASFNLGTALTIEYPPGETFEPGQIYRATWVQSIVDRSEAASSP